MYELALKHKGKFFLWIVITETAQMLVYKHQGQNDTTETGVS